MGITYLFSVLVLLWAAYGGYLDGTSDGLVLLFCGYSFS